MTDLSIKIELVSEGIFATGAAENAGADIDILKDDLGVPYLKGKTLKGKLREEAEMLKEHLEAMGFFEAQDMFRGLFGKSGDFSHETLKFSNCKISKGIEERLKLIANINHITVDSITKAMTEIRSFTKLDDQGIAEDGSLRKARVIKRGLLLYCRIDCPRDLTNLEKGLLASAVSALRNLGAMESRGKGNVLCRLLEDGEDVTEKYIRELEAVV
ncbi:RAMP superfamily CRISPR-associated protein [Clostridium polynesiense]|uniref:RAMP superfamily CRISPR-associated protein n=1 Tax=Clostridium polynesiense TaxID=1325933 RepID=UPI00058F657A|nr:RAMP superfamily CRISPR-associated protein [Clostridium polynesiense]